MSQTLVHLLVGHGVPAELRDGVAYVPALDRWANLWMSHTGPGAYLFDLRATSEQDEVVVDCWAALGQQPQRAAGDGIDLFCRSSFYVYLAGLWGVLVRDQVHHELRELPGATWDLYLGALAGRESRGLAPLEVPDRFVETMLGTLLTSLGAGSTHTLRVEVQVAGGQPSASVLLDDAPAPLAEAAALALPWQLPGAGFASVRWVAMARRRRGGQASHLVEHTLSEVN